MTSSNSLDLSGKVFFDKKNKNKNLSLIKQEENKYFYTFDTILMFETKQPEIIRQFANVVNHKIKKISFLQYEFPYTLLL